MLWAASAAFAIGGVSKTSGRTCGAGELPVHVDLECELSRHEFTSSTVQLVIDVQFEHGFRTLVTMFSRTHLPRRKECSRNRRRSVTIVSIDCEAERVFHVSPIVGPVIEVGNPERSRTRGGLGRSPFHQALLAEIA